MKQIIEDLRDTADEIEALGTVKEIEQRGYDRGYLQAKADDELFYILGVAFSILVGAGVILALCFGAWQFIHSASQQDNHTRYCYQQTGGFTCN